MTLHPKHSLYYRIVSFVGKKVLGAIETIIAFYVPSRAVFDGAEFEWVKKIEEGHAAIQKEYYQISTSNNLHDIVEISEEQDIVVEKKDWHFFPLYIYGIPIEKNISQCPDTHKLIEQIPYKTTVFFSVLQPGTVIKPHRGAFKGYLRYHLGVVVPSPNTSCGIDIENVVYHWKEGYSLIFDDTYMHNAWNSSDNKRIVLYVDFIRPMPKALIWISELITSFIARSPYIQNALVKLKQKEAQREITQILG